MTREEKVGLILMIIATSPNLGRSSADLVGLVYFGLWVIGTYLFLFFGKQPGNKNERI